MNQVTMGPTAALAVPVKGRSSNIPKTLTSKVGNAARAAYTAIISAMCNSKQNTLTQFGSLSRLQYPQKCN